MSARTPRPRARAALLLASLLPLACARGGGAAVSALLIVVDTLRADRLGAYGAGPEISPNLDAWAAAGRLFERAYATSPWTLPSVASIYTGQLPSRHKAGWLLKEGGLYRFRTLAPETPTLAELFARQGYATAAIVNTPFLGAAFGVARGFQRYDYAPGTHGEVRRADAVVDRAFEVLDAAGGAPFFLLLHFIDPHMDYDAPPPFRGRFSGPGSPRLSHPVTDIEGLRGRLSELSAGDRAFIRAAYDEELAFVDAALGRLFRGLAERGLDERCAVVLTSDHGEELFDHGGFEHGHALWEEVLRVPLVIWGPGVVPGRTHTPVSIADVAPTLLDAAGIAIPADQQGHSLWPHATARAPLPARTLFSEALYYGAERKAALRWPHKLVLDPASGERRLVDLAADPGERKDLAADRPDLAGELAGELGRLTREEAGSRSPTAALDPETARRLRELGYAE